jgi:hypothetical protein
LPKIIQLINVGISVGEGAGPDGSPIRVMNITDGEDVYQLPLPIEIANTIGSHLMGKGVIVPQPGTLGLGNLNGQGNG